MKKYFLFWIAHFLLVNIFGQSYITEFPLNTLSGPPVLQTSTAIFQSSDGKIWIKTNKGVFYYDGITLNEFNYINSCIPFSNNNVFPFAEMNGNIFVSLGIKGIARVFPSCEVFSYLNGNFPQVNVRNLSAFENRLYTTTDSSLFWFDGINYGEFTTLNSPILSNQMITLQRAGTALYVFHPNGVSIKTTSGWSFINSLPAPADQHTKVHIHDGFLWFILSGKAFIFINNQFVKPEDYFVNDNRKFLNECHSLFNSPYSELWAVSKTHVFNATTGQSFPLLYQSQNGNSQFENVKPLFLNNQEFVLTFQSKLYKYNLNQYAPYYFDSIYNYDNFKNTQWLDINDVKSVYNPGGAQFLNSNNEPGYLVDSLKTMYSNALWIAGKNTQTGQYHLSAEKFCFNGRDFRPGSLNNSGQTNLFYSMMYDRVWKINRIDVENFIFNYNLGNVTNGSYQIPLSIIEWPANAYPGFSRAPFHDANNDNTYNPYDGDYPITKGDQMIWWINNDIVQGNRESGGIPLGIEVEYTAYAYANDTATGNNQLINKTVFLEYIIRNKSANSYDSLFIGNFSDIDIDHPDRNHFGSCYNSNSYYAYRVLTFDDIESYNSTDVFQSVILLKDGIHNSQNRLLDGVGVFYKQPSNNLSDPQFPWEHINMLKQTGWKNGLPLYYGMEGAITPNPLNAEYAFPGNSDPLNLSTNGINPGFYWTALTPYPGEQALIPRDVRGVGRLGPYNLPSGGEIDITWAFTTLRKNSSTSQLDFILGDLCSYPEIIQNWYDTQSFPSGLDLSTLSNEQIAESKASIEVWPVPTDNMIQIKTSGINGCKTVTLLSIQGKTIQQMQHCSEETLQMDLSALSAGIYVVEIKDSYGASFVRKIVRK